MANRRAADDIPSVFGDDGDDEGEQTKSIVTSEAPPSLRANRRPFLVVLAGTSTGEMFPLKVPELVIGRARTAGIRLDDEGVSRRHARLVCNGSEVRVEDLGSANGTRVNDEKLSSSRLLEDGDKITLGSITILKFTYNDDVDETFQRRMFSAALRDGLTRTYNRSYLFERLGKELAFSLRHNVPLSLLVFDVDHFKKINDSFGHPAGDAVLVALAEIVKGSIRTEDVFARIGGEEFAVLCRAVDVERATVLAERLRALVEGARVNHDGREIAVTISVGIAGLPAIPASSPADLVAAADEALYEAKRGGRNRIVVKKREEP